MKIIDNLKPAEIKFGILAAGDIFEWAGDFYIKTIGEEGVRLEDGFLDSFPSDCKVRPVDATLTIS